MVNGISTYNLTYVPYLVLYRTFLLDLWEALFDKSIWGDLVNPIPSSYLFRQLKANAIAFFGLCYGFVLYLHGVDRGLKIRGVS